MSECAPRPVPWSSFADSQLRRLSRLMDVPALARTLGRTAQDIRNRAFALDLQLIEPKSAGPASGRWTPEEDDYLRERISTEPMKTIAKGLGRTLDAVKNRACVLGVKRGRTIKPWTEEEMAFIRANYSAMQAPELAEKLGRSVISVKARIGVLALWGGKRSPVWTLEEDEELRRRYPCEKASSLARRLGRSVRAVHSRARDLGVQKRQIRAWTDEEVSRLRELAAVKTPVELARMLGRTARSVEWKLYELRLRALPEASAPVDWTQDQLDLLRALYVKGEPLASISSLLGRTKAACRLQASKLGIRRSPPKPGASAPRKPRARPKPRARAKPAQEKVPAPEQEEAPSKPRLPKPKPPDLQAVQTQPPLQPKAHRSRAEASSGRPPLSRTPKETAKPDLTSEEAVAGMSRLDILKAIAGL